MNDKQYKSLKRRVDLMMLLFLGVLIYVIFKSTLTAHDLIAGPPGVPGPKGSIGLQGEPGQGIQGVQGIQGATIVQPAPAPQVITVQGATGPKGNPGDSIKGDKGEKGDPGDPAPTLEIQLNPDTGDLERKYSNDRGWTVLIPHCEITRCE